MGDEQGATTSARTSDVILATSRRTLLQAATGITAATVAGLEQYINFNAAGHQNADSAMRLEDVSLSFGGIEMEHVPGGASGAAGL